MEPYSHGHFHRLKARLMQDSGHAEANIRVNLRQLV